MALPEGATLTVGDLAFYSTCHCGDGNQVVLTDIGQVVRPQLMISTAGSNPRLSVPLKA